MGPTHITSHHITPTITHHHPKVHITIHMHLYHLHYHLPPKEHPRGSHLIIYMLVSTFNKSWWQRAKRWGWLAPHPRWPAPPFLFSLSYFFHSLTHSFPNQSTPFFPGCKFRNFNLHLPLLIREEKKREKKGQAHQVEIPSSLSFVSLIFEFLCSCFSCFVLRVLRVLKIGWIAKLEEHLGASEDTLIPQHPEPVIISSTFTCRFRDGHRFAIIFRASHLVILFPMGREVWINKPQSNSITT